MRYVILYSMLSPCNLIQWAQWLCHYGKHLEKSWHNMPEVILELPWYQISSTSMPTSVIREKRYTRNRESLKFLRSWQGFPWYCFFSSIHRWNINSSGICYMFISCVRLFCHYKSMIPTSLSCRWSRLCFYVRGVAIKKPDSCSNPLLKKNQTIEMLSPSM